MKKIRQADALKTKDTTFCHYETSILRVPHNRESSAYTEPYNESGVDA